MMRVFSVLTPALIAAAVAAGCRPRGHSIREEEKMGEKEQPAGKEEERSSQFAAWERVEKQLGKLKQVRLEWKKAALGERQRLMLKKLLEAARVMDELFLKQVYSRNIQIRDDLRVTSDPKKDLMERYFNINFGPFDRFDMMTPFINVPRRPPGATFYPENMRKEEFGEWIKEHPREKSKFLSNFTIIKRTKEGLVAVPYSDHYRGDLEKAAKLLDEAAQLSDSTSLSRFLRARSKAFLSNDYYQSDLLWMDVRDNVIDVTIGPYETYEDKLLGYKAAFEAFICLRDPEESEKLGKIKGYVPDMEEALPLNNRYRSAGGKKETPISVADVIYSAGDARAGVQTIAFNLPNDERVREKKGSKKVLLRNLINAKFEGILVPIGRVVISPSQQQFVSGEEFFSHTLLHEISHGIGPGFIKKGKAQTEVRVELKELYSAIEEAKADVLGMTGVLLLIKKGFYLAGVEKKMWVTFLASIFRSMRFGIDEAHGKANAVILNYLLKKGGYGFDAATGTFSVSFDAIGKAANDLAGELLMIEATGDYEAASALVKKYGVLTEAQKGVLAKLENIPVDIEPIFDLDF